MNKFVDAWNKHVEEYPPRTPIKTTGRTCPHCRGNGTFLKWLADEAVYDRCYFCYGTGINQDLEEAG